VSATRRSSGAGAHRGEQLTPFLAFPPEIRKIIYTTNAVGSLNSRFRQATRRRGHFPNEQAALKVLYVVIRSPIANRTNVTGRTTGWKAALNALALFYGDRITLNRGHDHRSHTIFLTDPLPDLDHTQRACRRDIRVDRGWYKPHRHPSSIGMLSHFEGSPISAPSRSLPVHRRCPVQGAKLTAWHQTGDLQVAPENRTLYLQSIK
jgi:hypothetical protein